jgi:hypothetical protein
MLLPLAERVASRKGRGLSRPQGDFYFDVKRVGNAAAVKGRAPLQLRNSQSPKFLCVSVSLR